MSIRILDITRFRGNLKSNNLCKSCKGPWHFNENSKALRRNGADAVVTRIFNKPIPFLPFKRWCRWGFGHHQNKCYGNATEDMAKCQKWMDEFGFIERPPILFLFVLHPFLNFRGNLHQAIEFFHGSFIGSKLRAGGKQLLNHWIMCLPIKEVYNKHPSPPQSHLESMRSRNSQGFMVPIQQWTWRFANENVESSTQLQAFQALVLNSFHLAFPYTKPSQERWYATFPFNQVDWKKWGRIIVCIPSKCRAWSLFPCLKKLWEYLNLYYVHVNIYIYIMILWYLGLYMQCLFQQALSPNCHLESSFVSLVVGDHQRLRPAVASVL